MKNASQECKDLQKTVLGVPPRMRQLNCSTCDEYTCHNMLFKLSSQRNFYKNIVSWQKTHPKRTLKDQIYVKLAGDCDKFVSSRGYYSLPVSEEEKELTRTMASTMICLVVSLLVSTPLLPLEESSSEAEQHESLSPLRSLQLPMSPFASWHLTVPYEVIFLLFLGLVFPMSEVYSLSWVLGLSPQTEVTPPLNSQTSLDWSQG